MHKWILNDENIGRMMVIEATHHHYGVPNSEPIKTYGNHSCLTKWEVGKNKYGEPAYFPLKLSILTRAGRWVIL